MIWPFGRSKTIENVSERHTVTLDLIEQVASLRGQVRSLEAEWDAMRAQIKKDYVRMERAYERQGGGGDGDRPPPDEPVAGLPAAHGFVEKLRQMKAG